MCVGAGFSVAPLLCGLAVVRVAFWCNRAVEPLLVTSWPPVRWCGPPGLANFDFRVLFLGTLKDFSFLGVFGWSLLLEAGVVFTIPCCLVVGCLWMLAGAGCHLAALVSTTLVGKIVSSCRGACVHGFRACDAKR